MLILHRVTYIELFCTSWSPTKFLVYFIILNFYKITVQLVAFYFVFTTGYLLTGLGTLYSNLVDQHSRFINHDSVLNSLYYYWTNFWFLLPTVLFIIWSVTLIKTPLFKFHTHVIWVVLLGYSFSISQYYMFNSCGLVSALHNETVNTLLTNSINKYHPFIFYTTILGLTYSYQVGVRSRTNYLIHNTYGYNPNNFLVLLISTLALGGWWALQEGSWGGWWNWDPSEVFGLVLLGAYLLGVHNRSVNWLSWSVSNTIKSCVYVFVLLYLFIQLNFDLVSHNFGTRTHQFVNSYYSYLVGLGALLVSLSRLWWIGPYSLYCLRVRARTRRHHLIVRSILLVTLILVLASLIDLFISFTWLLLNLNILNINFNFEYLVVGVTTLITILLYSHNIFLTVLVLILVPITWSYKLGIILVIALGSFRIPHKLVVIWLLLSLLYINQQVSGWSLLNTNLLAASQNYSNLKLNGSYIECSSNILFGNYFVDILPGFIKNSSTVLGQTFEHMTSTNYTIQLLKPFYFEFQHTITVIDGVVSNLAALLISWVVVTFRSLHIKPIIIF